MPPIGAWLRTAYALMPASEALAIHQILPDRHRVAPPPPSQIDPFAKRLAGAGRRTRTRGCRLSGGLCAKVGGQLYGRFCRRTPSLNLLATVLRLPRLSDTGPPSPAEMLVVPEFAAATPAATRRLAFSFLRPRLSFDGENASRRPPDPGLGAVGRFLVDHHGPHLSDHRAHVLTASWAFTDRQCASAGGSSK